MGSYIDHYIGEWENEIGNRLKIKKVDDETAIVSFFTPPEYLPINRPWCNQKPSINMVAKYNPGESPDLAVELWNVDKGFKLYLSFEFEYMLDKLHRDSLVPALSRYEEDDFLDKYYHYFEPLMHYIRRKEKQKAAH